MAKLSRFTRFLADLDVMAVFTDFLDDQVDTNFVDTITDSGTALVNDETNGVMTLTPSDGSVADNDEVYIASANELFIYAAGRPIYGRCRLQFTETSATIYNVGFGFMNAVGADTLIDNGGGPKVSGSTLAIYKTDGSGVWKCASSCNGTSTVTTSSKAAVTATWYVLEIEAVDFDGVSMEVCFRVDGEYLKDTNGNIIRHTVAIASATEMQVFAGAKLGAATNNDTTKVDYIYADQARVASGQW